MSQSESYFFNDRIEFDALTPAYRMAHKTTFVSLLAPAIVIIVMWPKIDHSILLGWGLLVTLGLFIQYMLAESFLRKPAVYSDVYKWGWRLSAVYFYFGLLWASAVFLFYVEGETEYQLFLLTLIVTFSMGTIVMGQHWFAMYYMYGPVTLAAVIIRLLMEGSFPYIALAFFLLLTGLGSISSSRVLHDLLRSQMRLRYEGDALAEALHFKSEEAEQATQAKSKFLAAASHDLRQPLYALSLFTSVLDEYVKTPKVRNVVDKINLSVNALQELFNALMDISRLDSGVMKYEKRSFDLQSLFSRLANDFDPQAKDKGLSIIWPDFSYVVYSDSTLLEQILRNYISNALRYSETGEIRVHCEYVSDGINIQVVDTGIGIPNEEQENIFKEFHQLGNPERDRDNGLGLGLAIVCRTAKLLGHSISLTSEAGQGSTFGITVAPGKLNESTTEVPATFDISEAIDNNEITIVVIDDEAIIREGMKHLLQAWGCNVITVSTQVEMLTQLKQLNKIPDGIIADYHLGNNQTGIEAIQALKTEYEREIPAMIMTGDIDSEYVRDVNDSSFQLLQKPVAMAKLRAFIRNIQLRK